MSNVRRFVLAALAGSVLAAAQPALAQTTLTMSSWVSPTHHITAVVLQVFFENVVVSVLGHSRPTCVDPAFVAASNERRTQSCRPLAASMSK